MPIRVVRRYAELVRLGEGTENERAEILERHREYTQQQLSQFASHVEAVEHKIAYSAESGTSANSRPR